MRTVILKGLFAHKLRLALTSLAIVLGVTFIAGTFVLTDTLHHTYYSLVGSAYQQVDFQVRGDAQLSTSGANAVRNPIPQALLTTLGRIPGVAAVDGQVAGSAQLVSHQGTAITNGAGGTVGVNFAALTEVATLHLVRGHAPTAADDVVIDAGTARTNQFSLGQRVTILSSLAPQSFIITGIVDFGTSASLDGTTLAAFTLPTAQRLVGEVGQLDDLNVVTTAGADKASVQRDITRLLPAGVQVVTGQTVANEQTAAIDQGLAFFSTALVIFALISLFVGGFTIFNTFSITVGQRTRELALLRVVGASRRQVFSSVLSEAAIVGAASSVIGVALGVAAAFGLEALLRRFGITLPSGPLVVQARTVIVALAVGIGVTTAAAIGPARHAVRVPPVTALSAGPSNLAPANRRRLAWGAGAATLGAALVGAGIARPAVVFVGAGTVCLLFAAAMLTPTIARPLAGALGRPLARLAGTPGVLGRCNAMRNPRRTAQTAAALMIGVALVSAMAVFGASVSRSLTASVDQAIRADLLVTTSSGSLPSSAEVLAAAVPGVTATDTVYRDQFQFEHSAATLTAVSPSGLSDTVNLRLVSGNAGVLADGQLLIDSTTAHSNHLAVGARVPVDFARTGPTQLRIGGIYRTNRLIGSYLVSDSYFLAHDPDAHPGALLVRTNGTSSVNQRIRDSLAAYPNVAFQTRTQFEHTQTASVNQLLGIVYALLALAGIIALIGIVNTLLLSVYERTHEIGLLRAIGMRRRQVRTMVRSEALIIAVFAAVIGITLGTGLGAALVSSLRTQGITNIVVPTLSMLAFLAISAIIGLAASGWPARRAAKLDVMAALATNQ
jgi:putative ABC transport system permease protein